MVWPMMMFIMNDVFFGNVVLKKWIVVGLFLGALLMGTIVFFEALPFDLRRDISGYRIQGIGGLIFLLFSQGYLWAKCGQHQTISVAD
jgi:hypothetical protein